MLGRVDIDPQIEEILEKAIKSRISNEDAIKLMKTTVQNFMHLYKLLIFYVRTLLEIQLHTSPIGT